MRSPGAAPVPTCTRPLGAPRCGTKRSRCAPQCLPPECGARSGRHSRPPRPALPPGPISLAEPQRSGSCPSNRQDAARNHRCSGPEQIPAHQRPTWFTIFCGCAHEETKGSNPSRSSGESTNHRSAAVSVITMDMAPAASMNASTSSAACFHATATRVHVVTGIIVAVVAGVRLWLVHRTPPRVSA